MTADLEREVRAALMSAWTDWSASKAGFFDHIAAVVMRLIEEQRAQLIAGDGCPGGSYHDSVIRGFKDAVVRANEQHLRRRAEAEVERLRDVQLGQRERAEQAEAAVVEARKALAIEERTARDLRESLKLVTEQIAEAVDVRVAQELTVERARARKAALLEAADAMVAQCPEFPHGKGNIGRARFVAGWLRARARAAGQGTETS